MLEEFRFHHIGYVTDSIQSTAALYMAAGYSASEVVFDEIQRVRVCQLNKDGNPCIELVEPADGSASANKILKKNGVSAYHVCYEVDNTMRLLTL